MEKTTSVKRSREGLEEEGPSVKRIKSGSNNEESGEYAEGNHKNLQQKSEIIRGKEEANFLKLFLNIVIIICNDKGVKLEEIDKSIRLIKSTFVKKEDSISFSDIDFTKWENICGYLCRFGSQGAGLARFRILNAIQNCKKLKTFLEKRHNLKVICFGAGPGNDALGLCSALAMHPENLKITLVDRFKEWYECVEHAQALIEKYDCGEVSKLFKNSNVELSFIQAELPGCYQDFTRFSKLDSHYFHDLKNSDVILICRLLTNINKSKKNVYKQKFTEILKENMKEDAIILLIDTFFDDNWVGFDRIYYWGDKEEQKFKPSCGSVVESKFPINVIVKQKK